MLLDPRLPCGKPNANLRPLIVNVRPIAVAFVFALALPSPAAAQDVPGENNTGQSTGDKSAAIVVTADRPRTQNLIDRKNYAVSKDLQAGSGSAADILRNIPSIDVDAQGTVSIRGDSNVQILIDGKPSTTMSSQTRADALEQFPASSIDHIEVITTPGAQYKPDASGGVINIVTKENVRNGTSGDVRGSAGTDGSFGLGTSVTVRKRKWTLAGSLNLRRDMRWRPFTDFRIENDVPGQESTVDQRGKFSGPKFSRTAAGSVTYDPNKEDELSAHGSYEFRTGQPHLFQTTSIETSGVPTSAYVRTATGHEEEVDSEASASYRHKFSSKDDHQFTLSLRRGESVENENRLFHSAYSIPVGAQEIDEQFPRDDEIQRELTAEYSQPFLGGKFLVGFNLEHDDDDFRNRGIFIDPVTSEITIDPTKTDRFHYTQTIDAGYLNFDRTFSNSLSLVTGVRLEETLINTDQVDLSLRHRTTYFRAFPSLHLEYDIADRQKFRLGYSHRIVRPDPEDLDPYPVFSDPISERAGNPDLKPEETQAVELEYERDSKPASIDVTAFVRRTSNEFTVVSSLITPTIVLTTHENLGSSTKIGIDVSSEGKILPMLSYRLSTSIYRDDVNASNLGYQQRRSAITENFKTGLDFNLSKRDLFQVNANYRGRTLTAQGERLASFVSDLAFRHTFHGRLVTTLAVADLFNSRRDRIQLTSSTLNEITVRRNGGRRLSLALTLPLGNTSGTASDTRDEKAQEVEPATDR